MSSPSHRCQPRGLATVGINSLCSRDWTGRWRIPAEPGPASERWVEGDIRGAESPRDRWPLRWQEQPGGRVTGEGWSAGRGRDGGGAEREEGWVLTALGQAAARGAGTRPPWRRLQEEGREKLRMEQEDRRAQVVGEGPGGSSAGAPGAKETHRPQLPNCKAHASLIRGLAHVPRRRRSLRPASCVLRPQKRPAHRPNASSRKPASTRSRCFSLSSSVTRGPPAWGQAGAGADRPKCVPSSSQGPAPRLASPAARGVGYSSVQFSFHFQFDSIQCSSGDFLSGPFLVQSDSVSV